MIHPAVLPADNMEIYPKLMPWENVAGLQPNQSQPIPKPSDISHRFSTDFLGGFWSLSGRNEASNSTVGVKCSASRFDSKMLHSMSACCCSTLWYICCDHVYAVVRVISVTAIAVVPL